MKRPADPASPFLINTCVFALLVYFGSSLVNPLVAKQRLNPKLLPLDYLPVADIARRPPEYRDAGYDEVEKRMANGIPIEVGRASVDNKLQADPTILSRPDRNGNALTRDDERIVACIRCSWEDDAANVRRNVAQWTTSLALVALNPRTDFDRNAAGRRTPNVHCCGVQLDLSGTIEPRQVARESNFVLKPGTVRVAESVVSDDGLCCGRDQYEKGERKIYMLALELLCTVALLNVTEWVLRRIDRRWDLPEWLISTVFLIEHLLAYSLAIYTVWPP